MGNEVAQNAMPSAISSKKHKEDAMHAQAVGEPSAPLFFDRAHDEFLSRLHDDFLQRYGIEIVNIRIENFRIMNDDLAANISNQALKTAETECTLANLKGQQEIAVREQDRLAAVKQISTKAEAEAAAIELKAAAEARRAEMLSKTPLGQQLSLALPYMEMMQKIGEGVEKVVYCDSTLQKSGNPFSLPTLQALNTDLALLNAIGEGTKQQSGEIAQA